MEGGDVEVESLPQRTPRGRRKRVDDDECATSERDDAAGALKDDTLAQPSYEERPMSVDPSMTGDEVAGPLCQKSEYQEEAEDDVSLDVGELLTARGIEAEEDVDFEYLDHTADVQIHAWGPDLGQAFAIAGLALLNYMTPLSGITTQPSETREFTASGHDLSSLLFAFLNEILFVFSTDLFVARSIDVTRFDDETFTIEAKGYGELFDRSRHEQGTEVKAITYSAMQVKQAENGRWEIFVIIDI